jgi:hypothetical protein
VEQEGKLFIESVPVSEIVSERDMLWEKIIDRLNIRLKQLIRMLGRHKKLEEIEEILGYIKERCLPDCWL